MTATKIPLKKEDNFTKADASALKLEVSYQSNTSGMFKKIIKGKSQGSKM